MQRYKELFEERAAIMEYDGGLSRNEAEQKAKKETISLYEKEGGKETEELQFTLRTIMFRRPRK